MNNSTLPEIAALIKRSGHILITSHLSPDGDSIGSLLGLGTALLAAGKQVSLVLSNPVPEIYRFLSGSDRVVTPEFFSGQPDLFIFLDCTDLNRAGEDWFLPWTSSVPVINIDHHISNRFFGSLNLVDTAAAATAEVICRLLPEMGMTVTPEAATALYTGIVTDTGSFQYQNTRPATMRLAAQLLESGVSLEAVRENVYESRSPITLQVLRMALDNLILSADGQISWTSLDYPSLAKIGATGEHCEGVVNYPLSIRGVKVGILFREMANGSIKCGLRSRQGVDVNGIAAGFGGGGHRLAAGCTLEGPLAAAVPRLLAAVGSALEVR